MTGFTVFIIFSINKKTSIGTNIVYMWTIPLSWFNQDVHLCVCLYVPSRNTHILVACRLLVKRFIANIGMPSHNFFFGGGRGDYHISHHNSLIKILITMVIMDIIKILIISLIVVLEIVLSIILIQFLSYFSSYLSSLLSS